MKNRKIALMLAGVLSLTMIVSGCGSGSKSASSSIEDKEITIMAPVVSADPPSNDNQLQKKLEELTGYKVNITWVPNSSYPDKVSITLASDKVPELMVIQGKDATTLNYVKKGAFWKLDDYIKDYPNLQKYNEAIKLNSSFNGDTYGIYRKRDVIRSNIAFRKDWLDKLGLKVPTTLEEFNNVLDKFTNNDPDGNGINDTTGIVIPKWTGINNGSPYDQVAIWFGAPNTNIIKDGKVVPDFMTDEYMKSLDYFKNLFDKGLMNKDFAVLDSNNWDDPFVNGKAGVLIDTQSRTMDKLAKKMVEKYGDDGKHGDSYVAMVGNIITDAGDHIMPTAGYSGMLMVPKQTVKDEKHLRKILDFMNKIDSEEVTKLLSCGIEGTYYEMKDGNYVPTTDKTLLNEIAAYSQLTIDTPEYDLPKIKYGNKLEADREKIMKEGEAKAVFDPCAPLMSDVYTRKGAQLQNIMGDARIQYIAGQIDKEGYKAAQQQWLDAGGKEYIDELTKLYNEKLKK
jgi:putative aldouronate transport system substrate-binding protein